MVGFNFGRSNNLGIVRVVADDDYSKVIAWWLSGRILGFTVNYAFKAWW